MKVHVHVVTKGKLDVHVLAKEQCWLLTLSRMGATEHLADLRDVECEPTKCNSNISA